MDLLLHIWLTIADEIWNLHPQVCFHDV